MHPLIVEDLARERVRTLLAEAARERLAATVRSRQVGGLRRSTGHWVMTLGAHIAGAAMTTVQPK